MLGLRTISKEVIKDDRFCDLEFEAQALYFHLLLSADDDGIIKDPYAVSRYAGCYECGAIDELVNNGFFKEIENGNLCYFEVNRADWAKHTGKEFEGGFFYGGTENVCKDNN